MVVSTFHFHAKNCLNNAKKDEDGSQFPQKNSKEPHKIISLNETKRNENKNNSTHRNSNYMNKRNFTPTRALFSSHSNHSGSVGN